MLGQRPAISSLITFTRKLSILPAPGLCLHHNCVFYILLGCQIAVEWTVHKQHDHSPQQIITDLINCNCNTLIRPFVGSAASGSEVELVYALYSDRNEDSLTKAVMANYERRCTSLQAENRGLRQMLSDMFEELNSLISKSPAKSPRKGQRLSQILYCSI